MPKKNRTIIIFILVLIALMSTASSCFDRDKPYTAELDQLTEDDYSNSENQAADTKDKETKEEETEEEETEAQTGVISFYDSHGALLLELEWMMNTLHPSATQEDLDNIVVHTDAIGDKKYSDLSKTAGVDVPQNEIVGWGYMMLSNFLPAGLPPDEIFPCDEEVSPDAEWHTVCMPDRPNNPWGDYYVIYTIHGEEIYLQDQTYYHSHTVVFDSDGLPVNNFPFNEPYDGDYFRDTDRQYEAWYDLDQGVWMGNSMGPQFSLVPSDARFVFKGNTVFALIPASDFSVHDPAGRVTTFLTTGGYAPEDCGYDTNGEDARDNLVPFAADPIYVRNEQAMLTGIVLDGYTVKGSGCTLAQRSDDGGQSTMLWCLDKEKGCKGNGGSCKLFSRLKGDSPQDEDSWNYVPMTEKWQKDNKYEYHCFCVK